MTLDEIWAKIPSFACKPGCSDCCGPVAFTNTEMERVAKWLETQGLRLSDFDRPFKAIEDCSFLNCFGRCSIYEARPIVCRLFGSVDTGAYECPYGDDGCWPEVPLTEEEAKELTIQASTVD